LQPTIAAGKDGAEIQVDAEQPVTHRDRTVRHGAGQGRPAAAAAKQGEDEVKVARGRVAVIRERALVGEYSPLAGGESNRQTGMQKENRQRADGAGPIEKVVVHELSRF